MLFFLIPAWINASFHPHRVKHLYRHFPIVKSKKNRPFQYCMGLFDIGFGISLYTKFSTAVDLCMKNNTTILKIGKPSIFSHSCAQL